MSVTENTEPKIDVVAAAAPVATAKTIVCDEVHQRRLAKRREYYQCNREHIRERDNASAQRSRQNNPERKRERRPLLLPLKHLNTTLTGKGYWNV